MNYGKTIFYDSNRNIFSSSKLFQNTRTSMVLLKEYLRLSCMWACNFRAVNLPEQRPIKLKLKNASVCTFILASISYTAFCLAF